MMKTGNYNFTRNWYEYDLMNHYVEGVSLTQDMLAWCHEHFGPAPKWGAYPGAPDAWSRWYCTGFVFRFRDEQDYAFFLLKWS